MKGVKIKEQMKSRLHLTSENLGRHCSDSFEIPHDDGSRKMKIAQGQKRAACRGPRNSNEAKDFNFAESRKDSVPRAAPVGQDRRGIEKTDHTICVGITST